MPSEPSASSSRRPTDHPDRYLIPADQVPPGVVERIRTDAEPVAARPAATIVLARTGPARPEILLVRRPSRSSFAARAWVFPGGMVDTGDATEAVSERLLGPAPDWWARRLDTSAGEAVGFVAAALREAWEETGILLSDPPTGAGVAGPARDDLLSGVAQLGEVLERIDLRLDAREIVYLAHWITPEPEARRYDTRFFLAPVADDARCDLVGEELREARWVAPGDAVAAYRAGDLRLLPPTVHTLQRLAEHGSVEEMSNALRDAPVTTIIPRMFWEPEGLIIQIPSA